LPANQLPHTHASTDPSAQLNAHASTTSATGHCHANVQTQLTLFASTLCRVTFEVQRLERTVQGANIPLPRTLIKTVLNMVLPKVSAAHAQRTPLSHPCWLAWRCCGGQQHMCAMRSHGGGMLFMAWHWRLQSLRT
jgi:hypothetical protein